MDLSHLKHIGLQAYPFACAVLGRPAQTMALDPSTQEQRALAVSEECCQRWETLQNCLRSQLRDEDDDWSLADLRRVAGMDISFENGTNKGTAVMTICEFQPDGSFQLVYEDAIDVNMDLPYVSGFLFVRELPGYQQLLQRLRCNAPLLEPDMFLIDGSGMFHPRQCGSASHFGVEENLRTIGVAKKLMVIDGDFDQVEGQRVDALDLPNIGDFVKLVGTKTSRVFGLALRTSAVSEKKKKQAETSKKRVYVSVGNRVSLMTAKDVVIKCSDISGGSYIPEPIRLADLTGRSIERAWQQLHTSSSPVVRQLVFDVCNLLDEKQRRTLHGMLEDRFSDELLSMIPKEELKRKRATVEELFVPFSMMHPHATVGEVRVALKMEKPWAISLVKPALGTQMSGEGMKVSWGCQAD